MPASVIVWDIETVPDLRGYAAAKGLVDKPDDEVRAEMGDKFPKLIYHSIICIGALVAQRREEHFEGVESPFSHLAQIASADSTEGSRSGEHLVDAGSR
jgi:hypothetical protein